MVKTLAIIRKTAWVTFLEIIRDKLLYNVVLVALLLLGLGFLASKLSFLRQDRMILDFGLAAVNLSCVAIALLNGAVLIPREFERRTIHVVLARPVSQFQFLLGKFSGLLAVLALNWLLLCVAYVSILVVMGGEVSLTLVAALVLSLVQAAIVGSMAVCFSSFSTMSLSIIITLGFYLIGNSASQIRLIAAQLQSSLGKNILNFIAIFLPNFEYFNLGTKVTYHLPISAKFFVISIVYGCLLIGVLLFVSTFFTNRREI